MNKWTRTNTVVYLRDQYISDKKMVAYKMEGKLSKSHSAFYLTWLVYGWVEINPPSSVTGIPSINITSSLYDFELPTMVFYMCTWQMGYLTLVCISNGYRHSNSYYCISKELRNFLFFFFFMIEACTIQWLKFWFWICEPQCYALTIAGSPL